MRLSRLKTCSVYVACVFVWQGFRWFIRYLLNNITCYSTHVICCSLRCSVMEKPTESRPGLFCWRLWSVKSGSSSLLWTLWLQSCPCEAHVWWCFSFSVARDCVFDWVSLSSGSFSCVICSWIWPVLCRRCWGRPTGDHASNTTTGERQNTPAV